MARFGLGRPGTGKMVPRDVGETRRAEVELQSGAVMLFGPYLAPDGITARARAEGGPVHAAWTCADDGEAIAEAFLHGRRASPRALAAEVVRVTATLRARAARCPVLMMVRSRSDHPVRFAWMRPDREAAAATGGPLVACSR